MLVGLVVLVTEQRVRVGDHDIHVIGPQSRNCPFVNHFKVQSFSGSSVALQLADEALRAEIAVRVRALFVP